ncbi:hypothetical protein [Streptomyces sp. NPDC088794]|uniref:hypothetical protein n=1 Tax=Streptomyces sp. NPDC088794 TaxID=3365902 RepID=UPI0038076F9B
MPSEPAETPACPYCPHPEHSPGAECEGGVDHGPKHWHCCLCLNKPFLGGTCHLLMDCRGGKLGYSDIWFLQRGHTLSSADGPVTPDVLKTTPEGAAAAAVVPLADQTPLRRQFGEVLRRWGLLDEVNDPTATEEFAFTDLLSVLPATDRATVYTEVADRLAVDAEQGDKEGLTRIYRRSAARQVRRWADELAGEARQDPTPDQGRLLRECECGGSLPHPDCPIHAPGTNTESPPAVPHCDGCGHPEHPARECPVVRYGERCECDEPLGADEGA